MVMRFSAPLPPSVALVREGYDDNIVITEDLPGDRIKTRCNVNAGRVTITVTEYIIYYCYIIYLNAL